MAIDNLSGQTLGVYQLRELIGSGGMGAVYHAYQTNLERDVALKVLPAALLIQPNYTERFFREAKIAASLEHPHIVPVYDYGTHEGISYVVMRLLTGGTLSERIFQRADESGPLPSCAEVAYLLTQLASALDYAHSRRVIHRDIKPSNVMFDGQGISYLVDFGIAKLVGETTSLTDTGITIGTPSHMAPEQWTDEPISPEIDQYALAVVIYNLLTGKLPFEATTPQAFMYKHLHEQPAPPHHLRDDVPQAVEPVLKRALAKSPDDRFETVTAFAQAFAAAVADDNNEQTDFFTFPVRRMPIILTSIKDTETDSEKWKALEQPSVSQATLPFEQLSSALDDSTPDAQPIATEATLERIAPVSSSPQTLPHAPQYAPPDARAKDGAAPPAPSTLTTIPPVTIADAAADATAPRTRRRTEPVVLGIGLVLLIAVIGLGLLLFRPEDSNNNAQLTRAVSNVTVAATLNLNASPVAVMATSTNADTNTPPPTPTRPTATPTNTVVTRQPSVTPLPVIGATQPPPAINPPTSTITVNVSNGVPSISTSTPWFGGFRTAIPSDATSIAGSLATPNDIPQATPVVITGPNATLQTQATPIVVADAGAGAALSPNRITAENANMLAQVSSLQPADAATIRGVALGGGVVAAAVSDGSIALWGINGTPLGTLQGHSGVVQAVAISRDGRLVAAGGDDGTVRLWDANGTPRAVLYGHSAPVRAVAFSPDGTRLASTSEDFTVRLWDVNTGVPLGVLEGHEERVMGVAFSPDGATVASGGEDSLVRLWNAATGAERGQLIGHAGPVRAVAFSPDGALIVTGSTDGTVRIWDAASGAPINTLAGHESWVFSVAFSPDGTLVASGGRDQTARVWDVASGQMLTVLRGHGGWVLGVAFSDDGELLASGSGDGLLRLWRVSE